MTTTTMTDDEAMAWLDDDERALFTADTAPILRKLAALREETHVGREYDLDSFKGGEHVLDGIENNMFRLDGRVYEAIEDEQDGYRSSLDKVIGCAPTALKPNIPPVVVTVDTAAEDSPDDESPALGYGRHAFHGYAVSTPEGRIVLLIGTNYTDDYYPSFTFRYRPVGAP